MPTDREVLSVAEQLTTLLVFLRREVVLLQLAAFGVALALAWLVTDGLQRYVHGQDKRRAEHPAGAEHRSGRRTILSVLARIEFPIVGVIVIYLTGEIMRTLGHPSGLLRESVYVLWLILGYRLIVGLIEQWLGEATARPYRTRLLAPLFALFATIRVLGFLIDLTALGRLRLFTVSETPILLGALFSTGVVLYFLFSASWAGQRILQSAILPRTNAEPGMVNAFLTIARYAVIIVATSFGLSALGFDTSTVAFVSGGITVAIGFGSQQVFANLVSGVLLLFDQSLRPGDVISVGGEMGVVESLSIRATTLRTPDNVAVMLPNQSFISSPIRNYSKNSGAVRVQIPVAVAFEGDPREVRDVLRNTALAQPGIMPQPEPVINFTGFGRLPSGKLRAGCQVAVWIGAPLRMTEVTSDLQLALYDALSSRGMELV